MKRHILVVFLYVTLSVANGYLNIPDGEKKKYAEEKKGWERNSTLSSKGEEKYNDHHTQNQNDKIGHRAHGIFNSRFFALALIGVASIYVFIMIC